MNDPFKKLHTKARTVALTPEEKLRIKAAVLQYADTHPISLVRKDEFGRQGSGTARKSWPHYQMLTTKTLTMTVGLIIAIVLGGGVTFAAEQSLPGDALYTVKTSVNENVQEFLAINTEAKARVNARLAERRLEEAEQLAIKGNLSSEVQVDLRTKFEARSENAQKFIGELTAKNDLDAAASLSSDMEARLKVRSSVLSALSKKDDSTVSVAESVEATITEIAQVRTEAENKLSRNAEADVEVAALHKKTVARNKIEETKRYVESRKERIIAESYTKVNARIALAEAAYKEAELKLEAHAYGEAFTLFQKAHRLAQEADFSIKEVIRLEIDLPVVSTSTNAGTGATTTSSTTTATTTATTTTTTTPSSEGEAEVENESSGLLPSIKLYFDGRGSLNLGF